MNVKHIAATLAILGSTSFALVGCNKKEGTETPAGDSAKPADGSCGEKKEGTCDANKDAPGGDAPADAPGGDPPAGGETAPAAAPPAAN